MRDPQALSPGSIMPSYPWLYDQELDFKDIKKKMEVLKRLGVPYENREIENAEEDLMKQANEITSNLAQEKINVDSNKEIIALIAYLQKLGVTIKQ